MLKTPILLLVFNRPAHASAVLDRLRSVRPLRLYLHADGARPDRIGEAEKVQAVRQVLENIDWECEVFRLYRDKNYGLREGVKGAIDWFFEHETEGIVLEDDSLPDPTFFIFATTLLERYRSHENIMHLGGSNLLSGKLTGNSSYHFSRMAHVWGWASWRRAWQKMSPDLEGLAAFSTQQNNKHWLPSPLARQYFLEKFWVTQRRENQSWAYAWQYSILKNNGLCIVPHLNLVENTGIGDAAATHTTRTREEAKVKAQTLSFPISHPADFKIDPRNDQALFYIYQKSKLRLWLWWLLKKLRLK